MKTLNFIKTAAFALLVCSAQESFAAFNKGNAKLNPNDINFLKTFLMQKSADGKMENYKVLNIKKGALDTPEKWDVCGDEGVDRNFVFVWKKDKQNQYNLIRIQFNKAEGIEIANLGGDMALPAPADAMATINLSGCTGLKNFSLDNISAWNKRQIYGVTIIESNLKKIDLSEVAKNKGSLIGIGIKKNNQLNEVKFSPINLKDENNFASISENPNLCAISGTVNFKQGGFFDIKKNALTFAQIAKLSFNNPQAATRITVGPQADFILSNYFNTETGNHEVKSGTVIDLSKEVNINWRGENRPVQVVWFKKEGKKKTLVEMKEVAPAKYELSGNAGEEYVLQLSSPNFFEGLSCKGAFTKIQSRTFIIK